MDDSLKARRRLLHDALREGRRRQHVEDATLVTPERRLSQAAALVAFAEDVEREHGPRPWTSDEPADLWLRLCARHRRLRGAPRGGA
jgi:hypothetical protein